MAEPTGVTPSQHSSGGGGGGGKIAPFAKKNKVLVIAGGAGLVLLLMSSKGKGSPGGSQADPYAQLAQGSADPNLGLEPPVTAPGAYGPVDTGDAANITYPAATNAPGAVNVSPPSVTVINATQPTPPAAKGKPAPKPKAKPAPKPHAGGGKPGTGTTPHRGKPKPAPKPKAPHKVPAPPAGKHGKPKETPHKTPAGHAKHSPVEVEAMVGAGAGLVIHGRHFPGAVGYREGAPLRSSDGTVCRNVTVNYGGHTETHQVRGNGDAWTDNVRGLNPPSRGVPQTMPGLNHAAL